jgi:hypothetical protein
MCVCVRVQEGEKKGDGETHRRGCDERGTYHCLRERRCLTEELKRSLLLRGEGEPLLFMARGVLERLLPFSSATGVGIVSASPIHCARALSISTAASSAPPPPGVCVPRGVLGALIYVACVICVLERPQKKGEHLRE